MKIRLKLTTPAGRTSRFEHEGPVVRIGRDPACELCLEGEDAGKAASRMHARIELTPTAVRLIDTDSANKTLHNNNPIEQPVLLQPGDRVQIGFTGTTLVVLDVERTAPVQAAPWHLDPRSLLAVAAGLAACLVMIVAVRFWPPRTRAREWQWERDGRSRAGLQSSREHQSRRGSCQAACATARCVTVH